MTNNLICIIVILLVVILIPSSAFSTNGGGSQYVTRSQSRSMVRANEDISGNEEETKTSVHPVEVVGSRLPDCTHACGSCSPCKLVIVSSICDSLHRAETCPVSYRCMCNNKSYPVP